MRNQKIINIAVIAHVDAGKSTLVDASYNSLAFFGTMKSWCPKSWTATRFERERGITIYSKNCSVYHNDVKINIVDTPGSRRFLQ
jgi:GTP-binding protein